MTFEIRCILGFVSTFVAMIFAMPVFIRYLKNRNINQVTSEYALEEFKNKEKTPIMGGLLFVVIPSVISVLLYPSLLKDPRFIFVLLSYLLYCSVGFIDDALVISSHSNEGLSPKTRLIMEFVYTGILFILFRNILPLHVSLPFTDIVIELKWFVYLPFMTLLYMAEANAVNFTDGMDGLCAGVSAIALLPMLAIAYHKQIYSIVFFLVCILAGLIGYLIFNFHPAKIFMGDSGSLASGALFASMGLLMDECIALFFIGGVFVIEMFCVVVQQLSVRLFHKRVFSYTPIHYAFVIKGYPEKKIVLMFYLLQLFLSVLGYLVAVHPL